MCCFSQAVERVSDTSIFARGMYGHQVIVYSMAYAARSDLAMILPLPVPARSPEDAVRFIDLTEWPDFFVQLSGAFQPETTAGRMFTTMSLFGSSPSLVVHEVGEFEASFVPGLSDFERLDPRFRIPHTVWDELPTYRDYGFAVFQLKATMKPDVRRLFHGFSESETRTVHPMAFEFPRRHPEVVYFPTLHVHDRTVHPGADFDHTLYCQPEPGWDHAVHLRNWAWSQRTANRYMDVSTVRGLINPNEHLFRLQLAGRRQNKDTWVSNNSTYPELVSSDAT